MFPQTASVLDSNNNIVEFPTPDYIGNKALYLLISSKVDYFYRNLIQHHYNDGDKALVLLKNYCANCTLVDKYHFHRKFTNLRILQDENATHFLKHFIIGKMKAVIANNTYSDNETFDLFLAAMNGTKNVKYLYVVQHYLSECDSHNTVHFDDIEWRLLAIDELSERERSNNKKAQLALSYNTTSNSDKHTKTNTNSITSNRTIKCYNCGQEGHISPDCPHPKRDCNAKSMISYDSRRRRGKQYSGKATHGPGKHRNQHSANTTTSSALPDTMIVHGCSVNVIHLDEWDTPPSPMSRWAEEIKCSFESNSCCKCPDDIDKFELFFVTWCLNVSETFNSKMELVNKQLQYGDSIYDLTEPLIVLSDLEPMPTRNMNYTALAQHGTYRNPTKRARQLFKEGILPALQSFGIQQNSYPVCFNQWHKYVKESLRLQFNMDDGYQSYKAIAINCNSTTIFLTFYPGRAASPILTTIDGNTVISSRDMETDYKFHFQYLDYDSPDCWIDPNVFWALVDKGYGEEPLPHAWQPMCSDLASSATSHKITTSSQPEPSKEGTVTADAEKSLE